MNKAAATVFNAPENMTIASCAASASNLFGAVTKGKAGDGGNLGRHALGKADAGVQPGAHRRAALRQFVDVGQHIFTRAIPLSTCVA